MICRYPVTLNQVRKDGRKYTIQVPCGKCAWCLRQKRNEWFIRFVEESKKHDFVRFVTYDYDDEHLPLSINDETGEIIPVVNLRDIQLHHKILRNKYKFRFFLASEYGPKNSRPHYHALYWSDEKIPFYDEWKNGSEGADVPASVGSFKYVTKYILKGSNVPAGAPKNFAVMSRKPGIGASFLQSYNEFVPGYRYYNKFMKMPSYYNRKFVESLSEIQQEVLKESKLDYLSGSFRFNTFLDSYEKYAPLMEDGSKQNFDDWLNDIYIKDYIKQFQINKK